MWPHARRDGTLSETIMHGQVAGKQGKIFPRRALGDDITNWTEWRVITVVRDEEGGRVGCEVFKLGYTYRLHRPLF